MSLFDRLVPAAALRWDRIHPMTTADTRTLFEWEMQFYRDHPVYQPDPGAFVTLWQDET